MTVSATTQTIEEGPRNLVMHWTGFGDGQGNENKVVKVTPKSLSPACNRVAMRRITGHVSFGVVELFWDNTPPVKFAELSGQLDMDFSDLGGLNNAVAGGNGNVLLSTVSFEATSIYDLTVEMVKKQ